MKMDAVFMKLIICIRTALSLLVTCDSGLIVTHDSAYIEIKRYEISEVDYN